MVNSYEAQEGIYDPNWRWVLDTKEDLEFLNAIFDRLYVDGKLISSEEVVNLLNQEPSLVEINRLLW